MRPQDLLHLIKFDFSLIETVFHPCISGVQVTAETDKVLTVDVMLKSPGGTSFYKFFQRNGRWLEYTGENLEEDSNDQAPQ